MTVKSLVVSAFNVYLATLPVFTGVLMVAFFDFKDKQFLKQDYSIMRKLFNYIYFKAKISVINIDERFLVF